MLLSVDNIHKTYHLGRVSVPVLRGVSLSVDQGECVAVLGASGSGKSTLLHLIGGLDTPDATATGAAPAVTFKGRPLNLMSWHEADAYRASSVGFVFQFYHLLPELTVVDNVAIASMVCQGLRYLSNRRAGRAAAAEILERVGLGHRLTHRPSELSGGERQRVAIARALINRPALLLADEPTGNLDRKTGSKILDLFSELHKAGQTMILVTHDEHTAARADRMVELQDGLIVGSRG